MLQHSGKPMIQQPFLGVKSDPPLPPTNAKMKDEQITLV